MSKVASAPKVESDVFTRAARYADPVAWHREVTPLREAAPVVSLEGTGIEPVWAVLGHAELLEVEKHHEIFTNAPACSVSQARGVVANPDETSPLKTLVEMDGAEHMAHRLLVNKWFLPASVRLLEDAVTERANEAIGIMASHGESCDFASDVALDYPLKVIMTILGVPDTDFDLMLTFTQDLMSSQDEAEAAVEAIYEFFEYFQAFAERRRAEPTGDLGSLIANAEIDGKPVGDLATFGFYVLIATAGHDTTSGTIAGGMGALADDPAQLEVLRQNPESMENATEEMVRWVTPVKHFMRTAQQDYDLSGTEIRAGDRLLLSYPSANRDEKVFDDPFTFDVARANADQHVGFGFGRHFCLGAHLARLETTKFYELLVPRLRSVEATGPPVNLESSMISGPTSLPINYRLD